MTVQLFVPNGVKIAPFVTVQRGQSLYPVEKLVLVNVLIFVRNGMMPVKNVKRKKLAILVSRKKKLTKIVQPGALSINDFQISLGEKVTATFPFVMARVQDNWSVAGM